MSATLLYIGHDPIVESQLRTACGDLPAIELRTARDLDIADAAIIEQHPDVVLFDASEASRDAFAGFASLCGRHPRLCAILIADRADAEQAIEAMKRGAVDYLLKPLDHAELTARLSAALRISRDMTVPTVYDRDEDDPPAGERIIGQSPAMHEVFKLIGLIAPRDVNVLVTGESGTGKELVAKALYHHSPRQGKPFLAVNCAAIPETLLESELFGHEKGAFTGADVRRIGKFEQCNGGTLFLDEIGDLPLPTQAKLLRVLQDGSFQRLGSAQTIHADVRIIAATNQPIEKFIEERRFRQDLYYRLKVTTIELPPLREREVDAVLLAHFFVRRFNRQLGTRVQRFSPDVLPALLGYPWPGNVRELENTIKAALVVARGNVLQLEFLPEQIRLAARNRLLPNAPPSPPPAVPTFAGSSTDPSSPAAATERAAHAVSGLPPAAEPAPYARQLLANPDHHGRIYARAVEDAERQAIVACLEHTAGQIAPAARLLGITRTTLRKKIQDLNLHIQTHVHTAPD